MKKQSIIHRKAAAVFAMAVLIGAFFFSYSEASSLWEGDLTPGTYEMEASLSCYVSAMGGIEFGGPLLKSAVVTLDAHQGAHIKLTFTKSSVTIYGVTCDTFVDAAPSLAAEDRGVKNGTIGYYDKNGILLTRDVQHTLSKDTVLSAQGEKVPYVETITFPLPYIGDEYLLTLYINSNVMGVQFCNKNDHSEATTYPAVLTLDWSKLKGQAPPPADTSGADSENTAVVKEEEGLNIHYVNQEKIPMSAPGGRNMAVYLIFAAAAMIPAGAILILTNKAKDKK